MKTTIEETEMIARFMGQSYLYGTENFSGSWNDLMPVVEKIAMLGYHFQMYRLKPQSRVEVYGLDYHSKTIEYFEVPAGTPFIQIVYAEVIKFVTFYNSLESK